MGKLSSGATDDAAKAAAGTFTASGVGAAVPVIEDFNVSLWGTFVATVQLERSFDGGTTWLPVTYSDGTGLSWTGAASTTFNEPEASVLYRLNCTSYTSGTVNWRISQ